MKACQNFGGFGDLSGRRGQTHILTQNKMFLAFPRLIRYRGLSGINLHEAIRG
jgi:hypothetical protein